MTHDHTLRVRYGETDQMGVVHHSNYLLYLEEARTAYMASLGYPYGAMERTGLGLAVRKVAMRFKSSAAYEDELRVRTRVDHIGAASVTFAYEVIRARDDEVLVTASTELACIDLGATRKPKPLPEELRAVLEPLVEV